ncbi:MAG: tetratricopeptide repeat protein [Pirellulales bacterium]
MATTPAAFETALAHHRAGRIHEAAALYEQVLRGEPGHADALHLLGVARHQSGHHELAVALISQAIALRGGEASFHANLGEVYRALGRLDQAGQCYRQSLRLDPESAQTHMRLGDVYQATGQRELATAEYRAAVTLRPDFAEAHSRLGYMLRESGDLAGAQAELQQAVELAPDFLPAYDQLAALLAEQGQQAEAIALYQRGLARRPQTSEFHFGLAVLHQGGRQFELAEAAYREAVRLNPGFAMAHNNLGVLLKDLGRTDAALACYQAAIAAAPQLAEPYYNIGIVRAAEGRVDEALAAYTAALERQPAYVKALVNLGSLYESRGQLDDALACYERVVRAQPELPIGHFSCGNVYRTRNMPLEAAAAYQEAIRLQPNYADAYSNLAVTYLDVVQPDAAEQCCRKGLEFVPAHGPLYSNLATALLLQGRLEEALEARRRAVELCPENAGEHSNLVYDLNFSDAVDEREVFEEHLAWARRHAEPLTALAAPHANVRDPERPLRVGYVSAFFREHAVNYFSEPILVSHTHEQFQIYCYSDVLHPDRATSRIKAAVDGWRDTYALSDAQLAEQVRADAIDILVDLTGHIGTNRLPLFARRPAPVQVTYIGYQNTTGMTAMDYRLTDAHADPPGQTDRYYSEKLVRLPAAFFCYRPPDDAPPVSELPARVRGQVTFGSFNKFVKVTPAAIAAWMRILSRLPQSRLLVLAQRGGHVEARLRAAAVDAGVEPERVELFDRLGHADYMRLVAQADMALDPFPFNGHTTTCDALWMGVPVVTKAGRMYASRYGSSAHMQLGLERWIASSVDEYVEMAARAAGDLGALAELRAALRPRMAASPLLDFVGFTRHLEAAYRQMWRTYCAAGSKQI